MNLLSIAFTLFVLMDPIGNIPLYISFLKNVPPQRQKKVICRELLIALLIVIFFYFIGDSLMKFLHVEGDTIQIAGGIILFLICLKMIFPPAHDAHDAMPHDMEPFIVPLAVPLIAGPSVLAAVIIYSKQESSNWVMLGAIFIAWIASLIILLGASFLQKILGWRGILAMERLMGLVLILIAVQMFLSGVSGFIARQ
jgi:multiple antibiotic resistance protein